MSSIATQAPARPARFFGQGLLAFLQARFSAWRRSYEIRARSRALRSLPDALLRDIGISRCEIDSTVIAMLEAEADLTRRTRP